LKRGKHIWGGGKKKKAKKRLCEKKKKSKKPSFGVWFQAGGKKKNVERGLFKATGGNTAGGSVTGREKRGEKID